MTNKELANRIVISIGDYCWENSPAKQEEKYQEQIAWVLSVLETHENSLDRTK